MKKVFSVAALLSVFAAVNMFCYEVQSTSEQATVSTVSPGTSSPEEDDSQPEKVQPVAYEKQPAPSPSDPSTFPANHLAVYNRMTPAQQERFRGMSYADRDAWVQDWERRAKQKTGQRPTQTQKPTKDYRNWPSDHQMVYKRMNATQQEKFNSMSFTERDKWVKDWIRRDKQKKEYQKRPPVRKQPADQRTKNRIAYNKGLKGQRLGKGEYQKMSASEKAWYSHGAQKRKSYAKQPPLKGGGKKQGGKARRYYKK